MTTGYTIDAFLEEATKKYILLSSILTKSYQIGYRYTENLELRLKLSNIYLWVLRRLGNGYALTNSEIEDITKHLIILLELFEIQSIDTNDFLTTTVKDNIIEIVYIPMYINNSVSFGYDTVLRPSTSGVTYSTDSNGNTVVSINHKLDKIYPQYTVVDTTTGSVTIPHVRFINSNNAEFTFTADSKGIITLI